MKKLFSFCCFFFAALGAHAHTLSIADEAVYLIYEGSSSASFLGNLENKQKSDNTKIWFSVTPKRAEDDSFFLEFVVFEFFDSRKIGNQLVMDTHSKYCSKELEDVFFSLQKFLIGKPIAVRQDLDGNFIVDEGVFEKIYDLEDTADQDDKKENLSRFFPSFAFSRFFERLAQELLELNEKKIQIGTIFDSPIGPDVMRILGANTKILQDAGMFMVTDMQDSHMRAIYRADCRIKKNFFIYQASAKGTLECSLDNLLQRSSHIDYEIQGVLLSLSYMEIKASENISPWNFCR